jgi:hypothetical protein
MASRRPGTPDGEEGSISGGRRVPPVQNSAPTTWADGMHTLSYLLIGLTLATSTAAVSSVGEPDTRAEAKLAKMLAGRSAGEPVNCISLSNIYSSEIIDHTAIVYKTIGGKFYVNTPRFGQASLDDDDLLITKTSGSQLCSLDNIQLFDRGARFVTGFVGLGDFIPYTKARK